MIFEILTGVFVVTTILGFYSSWNLMKKQEMTEDWMVALETRLSNIITKKVISDMELSKFNTAIASLMEYVSELSKAYQSMQVSQKLWKDSIDRLLLHLAPLAPHIAEELWHIVGNDYSIHQQEIPTYDESLLTSDNVKLILQVNGKIRDTLDIQIDLSEAEIEELALKSQNLNKHIKDKEIIKKIHVKNKLLNLVVK